MLSLRPIGPTPAQSVTRTAPLQLRYAACGAIQVNPSMLILWLCRRWWHAARFEVEQLRVPVAREHRDWFCGREQPPRRFTAHPTLHSGIGQFRQVSRGLGPSVGFGGV